jgi:hypothetical protein
MSQTIAHTDIFWRSLCRHPMKIWLGFDTQLLIESGCSFAAKPQADHHPVRNKTAQARTMDLAAGSCSNGSPQISNPVPTVIAPATTKPSGIRGGRET